MYMAQELRALWSILIFRADPAISHVCAVCVSLNAGRASERVSARVAWAIRTRRSGCPSRARMLSPDIVTDEDAFAAGLRAALEDSAALSAAKARDAVYSWARNSHRADDEASARSSQADGPLGPQSRQVDASQLSLSCTKATREASLSPSAQPKESAAASRALEAAAGSPAVSTPTERVASPSRSASSPGRRR